MNFLNKLTAILLLSFGLGALVIGGCTKDFLSQTDPSKITISSFFMELKQAESVVGAIYTDLGKAYNFTTGSFDNFVGHKFVYEPTLSEKDLLFPILDSEIENNKNLIQNPGY